MADDSASARARMVEEQIIARGVRHPGVIAAMREVPREHFVAAAQRELAYDDRPLPIEAGQTVSQPYIVAAMIEAAELGPRDIVLEIGAGSGYADAIMSRVAAKVFAIERHPELAELAAARLAALGCHNVIVRCGDGSSGWPEAAPFDAIIASAGAPGVPEALKAQLADGGRLVLPVGEARNAQRLMKITRRGGRFEEQELGKVHFVPLIGAQAWPGDI